jgi:hypothetical protein
MFSSLKLKWRIVKGKVIVAVKLKWKMLKCLMSNVVVIMIVPQICYKSSPQIISYSLKCEKYLNLAIGENEDLDLKKDLNMVITKEDF